MFFTGPSEAAACRNEAGQENVLTGRHRREFEYSDLNTEIRSHSGGRLLTNYVTCEVNSSFKFKLNHHYLFFFF